MRFNLTLFAVLWALAAVGLFTYAAGAARQGKAILLALIGSVAVGYFAAFAIAILAALLLNLSGEWSGIALVALMVVVGIGVGVITFIAISVSLLRRSKPSPPSSKLRLTALVLAVILTFMSFKNAYPAIPRLHPTSDLIEDIKSPFPDFLNPARKELARRGEAVIPEILDAANNKPNDENAFMLAQVIGDIPGRKATDALLVLLENPNPQIRLRAAYELARRKEKSALEPMLRHLSDPDMDEQHLSGMVNAIAEMGDASVAPQMLSILEPPPPEDDPGYSRLSYDSSFIHAMGKLKHPQAYERLISLSRHPRQRVRQEVIEQLTEYPSRRTMMALIELLDDPEIDVRRDADKTLAKMTGTYWDSDGRRLAEKTTEDLRTPYIKWLEKNPEKLPEEPSFQ